MKWLRFLFSRKAEISPEDRPEESRQTPSVQEWRYGVAGNITKTHLDDQEILRYGSGAFCGGAKVYLCGKYWTKGQNTIGVIGLNRYKRIVFDDVPPDLIENIRCTKAYKPSVLKLMDNWEFSSCWWDNSEAARKETMRFVEMWNEK